MEQSFFLKKKRGKKKVIEFPEIIGAPFATIITLLHSACTLISPRPCV